MEKEKRGLGIFIILVTAFLSMIFSYSFGPNSDVTLFINIVLSLGICVCLYLIIFDKFYFVPMLLIVSFLTLLISINHYYKYEVLVDSFPFLKNIDKGILVVSIIAIGVVLLLITKLFLYFDDDKKEGVVKNNNEISYEETKKRKAILVGGIIFAVVILTGSICCFVFLIKNGTQNNPEKIPMEIASQGLKYGVAFISILVLLCLIVVFLIEILKIIYHRFKLLGGIKKNEDDKDEFSESYMFNMLVFGFILFLSSYALDFDEDDLITALTNNKIVALPLMFIILVASFYIFYILNNEVIKLIKQHKIEEFITVRIRGIAKTIVEIVFDLIDNVLKFVRFIPDFFGDLSVLVLGKVKGEEKVKGKSKRIVKVSAFSFAFISWLSTAGGLMEYVFIEKSGWRALFVSFGIQGILFVLNLKLPKNFHKIPFKKKEDGNRFCRFFKNKLFNLRFLFVVFYCLFIAASSWFSYVYICNLVYEKTQYIDANIDIDEYYRDYLYDTDNYLNEYEKAVISDMNIILGEINVSQSDGKTSYKSIDDYDKEIADLENQKNWKVSERKTCVKEMNVTKKEYMKALDEGILSDAEIKEKEKIYKDCEKKVIDKEAEINAIIDDIKEREDEKKKHKDSSESIIWNIKEELKKENINTTTLSSDIEKLFNASGESNTKTGLISSTQHLQNYFENYKEVKEIRGHILDYINGLSTGVNIPDENNEEQVTKWKKTWKENLFNLEKEIKAVPKYEGINVGKRDAKENEKKDEMKYEGKGIDYDLLSEFYEERNDKINQMDLKQRQYFYNINVMERAVGLLTGKFNFLAIFSFIFAVFLDCASLLAGGYLYYVDKKK